MRRTLLGMRNDRRWHALGATRTSAPCAQIAGESRANGDVSRGPSPHGPGTITRRLAAFASPAAKVGLVVGIVAVVVLSPVPQEAVPDTTGWDKLNHLLAYCAVALCGALAFRNPRALVMIGIGLFVLGGALEVVQAFLPNREASFADGIANGIGIATGLMAGRLALSWRPFRAVAVGRPPLSERWNSSTTVDPKGPVGIAAGEFRRAARLTAAAAGPPGFRRGVPGHRVPTCDGRRRAPA